VTLNQNKNLMYRVYMSH